MSISKRSNSFTDLFADIDFTRNSSSDQHNNPSRMPPTSFKPSSPPDDPVSLPYTPSGSVLPSRLSSASSPSSSSSSTSSSHSNSPPMEHAAAFSRPTTVPSNRTYPSSPLNPSSLTSSIPTPVASPFARPGSWGSIHAQMKRVPSEEARVLAHAFSFPPTSNQSPGPSSPLSHELTSHASMILYRRAPEQPLPSPSPYSSMSPSLAHGVPGDTGSEDGLLPPTFPGMRRSSMYSTSGDSSASVSISGDSKYPARNMGAERGLVAYAYDPAMDDDDDEDDGYDSDDSDVVVSRLEKQGSSSSNSGETPASSSDQEHPEQRKTKPKRTKRRKRSTFTWSWRGFVNVCALLVLLLALLSLFIVYPVILFYRDNHRHVLITRNERINSTGQAVPMTFDPREEGQGRLRRRNQITLGFMEYVTDPDTPSHAWIKVDSNGIQHDLVFSDEFEHPSRQFDNDGSWEVIDAVDSEARITTRMGRIIVLGGDVARNRDTSDDDHTTAKLTVMSRESICRDLSRGMVEVGFERPMSGQEVQILYFSCRNSSPPLRRMSSLSQSSKALARHPLAIPPSRDLPTLVHLHQDGRLILDIAPGVSEIAYVRVYRQV